jgi:hypothetical protein
MPDKGTRLDRWSHSEQLSLLVSHIKLSDPPESHSQPFRWVLGVVLRPNGRMAYRASGPPPDMQSHPFTVSVRRGDRWFSLGSFRTRHIAERVASRWGKPGQALIACNWGLRWPGSTSTTPKPEEEEGLP